MLIKTKKFILRHFKMSDAPTLAKNINDKRIARYTTAIPYPYKLKDGQKWLKRKIKQYKIKNPQDIAFAIEIDGEVVGGIGIHKIIPGHKAEFGAWLAYRYWNKGLMTQAIKKIITYAFNVFKLKRIEAKVMLPNLGSKAVAEKNGFILEGIMKKEAKVGRKYYDVYLLAKTR